MTDNFHQLVGFNENEVCKYPQKQPCPRSTTLFCILLLIDVALCLNKKVSNLPYSLPVWVNTAFSVEVYHIF